MANIKQLQSGFVAYWDKQHGRQDRRETVEQFEARGGKIERLAPQETSGKPLNEWRSSYEAE